MDRPATAHEPSRWSGVCWTVGLDEADGEETTAARRATDTAQVGPFITETEDLLAATVAGER